MGLFAPEAVWLAGFFSGNDWSAAATVVPILALGGLARSYYTVVLTVLTSNKAFARWIALVSIPALPMVALGPAVVVLLAAAWRLRRPRR